MLFYSFLVGSARKCGGWQGHYKRMDALADALSQHALFQRRQGEDFLFVLTHRDPLGILGPTVMITTPVLTYL